MSYKYKKTYKRYRRTPRTYYEYDFYKSRNKWMLKRKLAKELKYLSPDDIKLLKNLKNATKEDWAYLIGMLSGIGLIGFILLKPGGDFWADVILEFIE